MKSPKLTTLKLHRMQMEHMRDILLDVAENAPKGANLQALLGATAAELAQRINVKLAEIGFEFKLSITPTEALTLQMCGTHYMATHNIGRHQALEIGLVINPLHQLLQ